ncbi:MAG: hypothetical protein KDD43_15070, partial [Bdellovibrionales bacterium]|nr:hypothetical protein [Bdellovibrionales bacterium]
FCDWGSNTFAKVRRFPMERLQSEIEWFSSHQINRIFIADANFGMFPRDLEITQWLIAAREKSGFPADVHWMPAKNQIDRVREISEKFFDSGLLHSVIVGFQSTQEQALRIMERMNLGQEKHKRVIQGIPEKRDSPHWGLDYGLPGRVCIRVSELPS